MGAPTTRAAPNHQISKAANGQWLPDQSANAAGRPLGLAGEVLLLLQLRDCWFVPRDSLHDSEFAADTSSIEG